MAVTEPRCTFDEGDRCHAADDGGGILVVCDIHGPADEFELTEGITVADVNPQYPRDDPVVTCVYEYAMERDVDPEYYYFPAGKLERYDAGNYVECEDGVECQHCRTVVPSTTAWVEHVVTSCSR